MKKHAHPRQFISPTSQFALCRATRNRRRTILICAILLAFGFPSPYDGSLFAIPVALAAWLFKGRGALICISSVMVLIAITHRVRANGLGSSSLLTVLLIEAVALSAEGTVIAYLRYALDLVQVAQAKAQETQQAQLQAQLAYHMGRKTPAF